jgi:hypothetical protein
MLPATSAATRDFATSSAPEIAENAASGFDREGRLADAPGPGERNDAISRNQVAYQSCRYRSADGIADHHGEVVGGSVFKLREAPDAR